MFALVAGFSFLVDRLLAGRLLVKKRVQQRVLQRGGGAQPAETADENGLEPDGQQQQQLPASDPQAQPVATDVAGASSTGGAREQPTSPPTANLPERENENESAAYVPGAGDAVQRAPWNPEEARAEHSRSNSSDNTHVSPVH